MSCTFFQHLDDAMIDKKLTDLNEARRDRAATLEEHAFLHFCTFKHTRIPVSRGTLYAHVFLNQN